jgi:dipeptide/tripeptide permease
MIPPVALGALIVGVPAVVVAYLALFKAPRAIFWFALALIVVGLGYLGATGALVDIADAVLGVEAPPVTEPSPVSP